MKNVIEKAGYILSTLALGGCLTGQPNRDSGQSPGDPVSVEYVQGDTEHGSFHRFKVRKSDAKGLVNGNFVKFKVGVEYTGETPFEANNSDYNLGADEATLDIYNLDAQKLQQGGKVKITLFKEVTSLSGSSWKEAFSIEDANLRDFPADSGTCYITEQSAPAPEPERPPRSEPNDAERARRARPILEGTATERAQDERDATAELERTRLERDAEDARERALQELNARVKSSYMGLETIDPAEPHIVGVSADLAFDYVEAEAELEKDYLLFDVSAGNVGVELFEVDVEGAETPLGKYTVRQDAGSVAIGFDKARSKPHALKARYISLQSRAPVKPGPEAGGPPEQSEQPAEPQVVTKYALAGDTLRLLSEDAIPEGFKRVEVYVGEDLVGQALLAENNETLVAVRKKGNFRFKYVKADGIATENLEGTKIKNIGMEYAASNVRMSARLKVHRQRLEDMRADTRRRVRTSIENHETNRAQEIEDVVDAGADNLESSTGPVQQTYDSLEEDVRKRLGQQEDENDGGK